MDATATVSFRMDAKLKKNFVSIIQMMGLNMTTAFTVFAIQVVNEGRIPFAIKADPFWGAENQARLRESIAQLELGKVNEHDLIEGGQQEDRKKLTKFDSLSSLKDGEVVKAPHCPCAF